MATLRDEIDKIIAKFFIKSTWDFLNSSSSLNRNNKQMLNKIMDEIDKDKEAMCEECPGNHLK